MYSPQNEVDKQVNGDFEGYLIVPDGAAPELDYRFATDIRGA